MRRRTALGCALAATTVVVIVIAVVRIPSGVAAEDAHRAWGGSVPILNADFSGSGPGSLARAVTMPGLRDVVERRMRAARVTYRSTAGDGTASVVSGSVFVPEGDPPAGGWPAIAVGHGTTGIDASCAPSSSSSLLGYAPVVDALIRRGYAVALPDYQGIGSPGIHPYSDARTAGLNMIDAVRALRATFRDVSDRWGAFGGSQGGGAAWAADEQARTYAPELRHVGAVAASPLANATGLVDAAERGALTPEQNVVLSGILQSLSQLHPDVDRADYFRAKAPAADGAMPCSEPDATSSSDTKYRPAEVEPRTPAAADRLRRYLADWALPQQRLSAPLYVWYSGRDTSVDPSSTAAAISRACAMGGMVAVVFEPTKGHSEINYNDQFDWLTDRFAGRPVINACR